MSTIPLAQWLAHRPRRGASAVDTIVLHHSDQPSVETLVASLRAQNQSYHYVIDLDGTIHKCVPYPAVAFHAGNSYGPHEAARKVSREQDVRHHFVELTTVHEYTISVCLMRVEGSPAPKEQIEACKALLTDLKNPLPKLKYLTTHAWVAPGQVPELEGVDVIVMARDLELSIWHPDIPA